LFRVYFLLEGDPYEMNPDGSGMTASNEGGIPSHDLHGLERWFLRFRAVQDDDYPSSNPRYELFAVSESGTAVQLTDGETSDTSGERTEVIEPNSNEGMDYNPQADPRWATDGAAVDGKVSYLGGTWAWDAVAEKWYVKECGIYVLLIDPTDLESHSPAKPTRLPIALELTDYSSSGFFVFARHSWSPDGDSMVYDEYGKGISRADESGQVWSTVQLTTDGGGPEWSPDGNDKILFVAGHIGIDVMDADGTDRTTVIPVNRRKYFLSPHWSPNGTHIVYRVQGKTRNGTPGPADVYRAEADGDNATNLTKHTDGWCTPVAWRGD
jgi:hypothetical protein